jgi:hypothetical protein
MALEFWGWGLWAGIGAVALARARAGRAWGPWIGVAVAALPIALNWAAVTRRVHPESTLPRMLARTLLEAAPPGAVLLLAGDNDSYPAWYLQEVEGVRRDVALVTLPLLAAPWYEAEVERRHGLLPAGWRQRGDSRAAALVAAAGQRGRPVAVALTVPAAERRAFLRCPAQVGMILVDRPGCDEASDTTALDRGATAAWADTVAAWQRGARARPSIDPVSRHFLALLQCPAQRLRGGGDSAGISLDSPCKRR